jgi:hypothetical protein
MNGFDERVFIGEAQQEFGLFDALAGLDSDGAVNIRLFEQGP